MKRRYNTKQAYENIEALRDAFPTAMFTTDLMVGFPGESEEDFSATLTFVKEVGLLDAHVFAYSRREGTPAAEYAGQIPEAVKRERSARLIFEKNRVREALLNSLVEGGKPLSTVLESYDGEYWTGHSDSFVEVRVRSEASLGGKLVSVIPESTSLGAIYGRIAENDN